ncbi:spore coat protein SP96-like isoform X2 [Dermacentor albipictus]|uniref:spore coat protein SP96-like isoform X2 n=1 Tax=Dermacentor albipictus TaxID=60249 RepID=UPI0038FCB1A6
MKPIAIIVSAIFCAVANGQEPTQSSPCGCLEEPAGSSNRKEKFCRPHLTPPSELNKPRNCICRPGLVRNAWGDCITKHECTHCKCFRDRDFNVCARKCPLLCNQPIRASCSQKCVLGCDCPPGSVRDPRVKKNVCVKTTKCAPTCPPQSRFEPCVSTCAPKCGKTQPTICTTRCQRGGCVCLEGYAEAERDGAMICVPLQECYKYTAAATSINSSVHGHIAGSTGAAGTALLPGFIIERPGGSAVPGVVVSGPGGISIYTQGGPSRGTSGVGGAGGGLITKGTGSPDSVESGETGAGINAEDIPSHDTKGSGRGGIDKPLGGIPSGGPAQIGGAGTSAATVASPSTAPTVDPVSGGAATSVGATGAALQGSMTPGGAAVELAPPATVHLPPTKLDPTKGK